MILNFIFSNLNFIVLGMWTVFLIIITIRFVRPNWLGGISFLKLSFIAIALNILYGAFVTWGQYYVWSQASDMTRSLLSLPLPKEVPLPAILEWTRTFFAGNLGYFSFYILGRVWFSIFITFVVSAVLYGIFRVWNFYRGSFLEYGPELLLALMLSVGSFPGLLIMISIGFVLSVLLLVFNYFKGKRNIKIEPMFIIASFIALIFAKVILSYVL